MSIEIGTTTWSQVLGYKGKWAKMIYLSCPECGLLRWVRLEKKDCVCRSCANRISSQYRDRDAHGRFI